MKKTVRNILVDIGYFLYRKIFFHWIFWNPKIHAVIINEFHKLYYYQEKNTWRNTYWLNTKVLKVPLDLWIYQEIITETRPDVIIETGTAYGGSALYFATICEALGRGRVITVDIETHAPRPRHKRIAYIRGSSTSTRVFRMIQSCIKSREKVMVILDSDHTYEHVYKEMQMYHQFVTKGCYLVVEDTHLNGNPARPDLRMDPLGAVRDFLRSNKQFKQDHKREKFLFTYYPGGFLRKIA